MKNPGSDFASYAAGNMIGGGQTQSNKSYVGRSSNRNKPLIEDKNNRISNPLLTPP